MIELASSKMRQMKALLAKVTFSSFLFLEFAGVAATRYVDLNNPTPTAPYLNWNTAATNIQDAIDTSVTGEAILVTNGVYRFGGKVMGGDLTNRVALTKAITVQSVNGPEATIIEGNWNPTVTNGPAAVRCAWLTNGASLSGFTLRGGGTRAFSGSTNPQMYGGGVWGSSTNANVVNCLITTNTASRDGGGAYQVALVSCTLKGNRSGLEFSAAGPAGGQGGGAAFSDLRNCIVQGNFADRDRGGGVRDCNLVNCALLGNSSYHDGGAAYAGKLVNCTVTGNTSSGYSGGYGAAVHSATLTNCLVWGNFSRTSYPNTNYASSSLAYCLSSPLAAGVSNLNVDPLILDDGVHLTEFSPCRAAGASVATVFDIDGQPWTNPPAIGCDEWQPIPLIGAQPTFQIRVASRTLKFNVVAAGKTPLSYSWFKNGMEIQNNSHYNDSDTPNLKVNKFGAEDAGAYQVVVSNAFGVATSQVAQVVIHCVDLMSGSPAPPYSNWATAANSIQDAIDAAATGEIILVTNGVYAVGGRAMSGDLTNRVVVDKPVIVLSVNGYRATIIEGAWDPVTTNGTAAVRGVWMANGAMLGGFTVRNGATRGGNYLTSELQCGGGVWAASTSATVVNCLFTNNSARYFGAGVYDGTLKNCILTGNIVDGFGGGAAAFADLRNCTIYFNFVTIGSGKAGTHAGTVRNCIVVENYRSPISFFPDNYSFPYNYSFSCSYPLPSGVGNISVSPSFLDAEFHLPAGSPCRGVGSSLYASGEDMDGEEWLYPPSMGADEVIESNLTGPISLSVNAWETNALVGNSHLLYFWDSITGRVSRIDWDFGDGVVMTNTAYIAHHSWTNPGSYPVTSTAYNTDYPGGVSASVGVEVLPINSPVLQLVSLDTNGFKLSFEAQVSARYDLQLATNLAPPVMWQTLQIIPYSYGGTTLFTDPAWTNTARFYRVRAQ